MQRGICASMFIMVLVSTSLATLTLPVPAEDDGRQYAGLEGFTQSSTGLPTNGEWVSVTVGHFNRDNYPDIGSGIVSWAGNGKGLKVWTSVNGAESWQGNFTGLPQAQYEWGEVASGDVDEDGDLDLLAPLEGTYGGGTEGIKLYLNDNGTDSITWSLGTSPASTGSYESVVVGYLDTDDHLDVVAGSGSNNGCRAWLGDGTGSGWTDVSTGLPATGTFYGVAIGDVDNDGDGDIACNGANTGHNVFIGNNGASWTEQSSGLHSSRWALGVELVDLNNDGNLDYLTGAQPGFYAYMGNGGSGGTMSWTSESSGLPTTGFMSSVSAGDVDGDGYPDIITGENYGGGVHFYTSDDCDTTCDWTKWTTGLPTTGPYSGTWIEDMDLDGDLDIVVSDSGLNNGGSVGIRVYLADGDFGPRPPVPNAGEDQTVYVGDPVILDGSASEAVTDAIDAYDWNISSVPAGSTVTLSAENIVSPTFTPDLEGEYRITLQVRTDIGLWGIADDEVIITAVPFPNAAPIAKAGPDQEVPIFTVVQLDGSASTDDPEGSVVGFDWNITKQPDGSAIALSNESAADPTFTPEAIGNYEITLTVLDNNGTWSSKDDKVLIKANPQGTAIPQAEAGPDAIVEVGTQVTLDGSASVDDLEILEYLWAVDNGPSTPTIINATEAIAFITPDAIGPYQISLKVRDNDGYWSDPDFMSITAVPVDLPPIAEISSPDDGDGFYDVETILFDATGSEDPEDGDITYEWSSDIDGLLSDELSFETNLTPGEYTITLTVMDDHDHSTNASISITIIEDLPPTAALEADGTLFLEGVKVTFEATGEDLESEFVEYSFDFGDGKTSGWQRGFKATHSYSKAGTYDATVTVRDSVGYETVSSAVTITVGAAPVARLSGPKECTVGKDCMFNAGNSTDADGSVVSYMFEFGDGTTSEWVNGSTIGHLFMAAKSYTVKVTVMDDQGFKSPQAASLTIKVVEPPSGGGRSGTSDTLALSMLPIIIVIVIIAAVLAVVMMTRMKKKAGTPPQQPQPAQALDPTLGYPGQAQYAQPQPQQYQPAYQDPYAQDQQQYDHTGYEQTGYEQAGGQDQYQYYEQQPPQQY